ncbi:Rab3 GTPase-activating protein catalytic subunit [Portunus trituberculatus]|uniref:Rab3 GTPase-activating protein catalytic subunit n=1 Tax=Portunus trituberculatus TaxID=210409 RepID=A0A5B7J516_PORTR|nr:Rab3 GTPase-activating protein catalytic subunit [Portunus trituberculatus]
MYYHFCFIKASLLLDDSPQDDFSIPEHRQSCGNSGHSGAVSELGKPMGREYLLRTLVPFPTAYSRPVPHRMFAVLLPNEFRLTGAFSQDTTFS